MAMGDVSISLVSRKKLTGMTALEKVSYIIDEVKRDKILVLEVGLDPKEEANLIERTMREIEPDKFIGIEMESYKDDSPQRILGLLRSKGKGSGNSGRRASMTVVGPADRLRTISKDGTSIQALILSGEREKLAAAAAAAGGGGAASSSGGAGGKKGGRRGR